MSKENCIQMNNKPKFHLQHSFKKGNPTFFQYYYFKIPAEISKNLPLDEFTEIPLVVKVAADLYIKYQDNAPITALLKEINQNNYQISIKHPKDPTGNYFRFYMPFGLVSIFKRIFFSSLVYYGNCPQEESVDFDIDLSVNCVHLSDMSIYEPQNNQYYSYLRTVVENNECVLTPTYTSSKKEEKIRNYYDDKYMSKWKPRSRLSSEIKIDSLPGIYMLYNSNSKELYVGKAKYLKKRIEQHGLDPKDPMSHYTHYRYTVIHKEYYDHLYLIENTAIHDLAWIIEMPKSTRYIGSLQKSFPDIEFQSLKLKNSVDFQTKIQN